MRLPLGALRLAERAALALAKPIELGLGLLPQILESA